MILDRINRPLLCVLAHAAFVLLTSRDGGNAIGLYGTILAMHVRCTG
jgi:hypothetical protein